MDKFHRAQKLFEPEQHASLAEITHNGATSISELIRAALCQILVERQEDYPMRRHLEALGRIRDSLSRTDICEIEYSFEH